MKRLRGPCKFGHPVTPENTVRVGVAGYRCRICRQRIARHHWRMKSAERFDAEELTSFAQRYGHVLRRLKPKGRWSDGPAPWHISNSLISARRNGLVESKVVREYPVECRWRITPLGVAALAFADELNKHKARGEAK